MRILSGFSSFVFKIEKRSSWCDIFSERYYWSLFENVRYICIDIINFGYMVKYWSLRILFFNLLALFIKNLWLPQYWYKYSKFSSTELSEFTYKYGANHKIFNKNGRKTKKLDPPR